MIVAAYGIRIPTRWARLLKPDELAIGTLKDQILRVHALPPFLGDVERARVCNPM
jgi:hypothetical protein